MEQTASPPPQPPLTATTAVTTATTTAYPGSVDSSPRSRNTDSWIEDSSLYPANNGSTAAAVAPGGLTKLRLMCSYGGHIVPRPHDKSLCYVGGDTRIVVVNRHTTLSDLTHRLTKTLLRSSTSSNASSFTIKYQLPLEDLDSLISVTTDEDLENMIDEYERLNSNSSSDCNKSSRIRLFLFPIKPESVSSIGSLLENTIRSEDWFLNALNGTSLGFSETSSVNCLLGLEDDVSIPEKKDVNNKGVICKQLRENNSFQDVQSVPDSPMVETLSSFGSASSAPALANLPPIVNVDDQQKVAGGIEEQFSQMSVQQHLKHQDDVNFVAEPAPTVITGVPIGSKVAITENPNPNRVLSEDERSEQGFQMAHNNQQQQQQIAISSDWKPSVIYQDPATRAPDPTNILDQNTRIKIQQQDSPYLLSNPTTRVDPQNHQLHHQPQFIHTAVPLPQYLHHHPSGAVPMAPFYQMYPSGAVDQHNFVYYMPARQPPQGYNPPLQADASPAVSAPPNNQVPLPRAVQIVTKTEPPAPVYGTTMNSSALAPRLVQIPSSQHQILPQFVGYSHVHQPSQPVPSGGGGGGNFVYEFTDSSQKGQHIYYAAQSLPPQPDAQYQSMTSTLPVEAQANQQVRTSQP